MNIAILGADGQLGQALQKKFLQSEQTHQLLALGRKKFDLSLPISSQSQILKDFKPNYIVNCAAYTQVDKAESEPELAMLVNGSSLKALSELSNQINSHLIHISTDFVFDGTKNTPYKETDHCNPLSIYGKSKLVGEELIQEFCESSTIFRTSWVYSHSHPCFLNTMLRLAQEREELKVVCDQIGTPTSVQSLSDFIKTYIDQKPEITNEIYHYSNSGVASWYDFAHAIFKAYKVDTRLIPISTNEYPTPAKRPSYSVLSKQKISNLGFKTTHWVDALETIKLISDKEA